MYFQNAILVPMWLKIIATIYYPIFCRHCNTSCHLILITNLVGIFLHFTNEGIETGTLGNLLKIMQLINAKSYQALSPAPSALPNTASHLGTSKCAIFHRRVTHLSGGWIPEQPSPSSSLCYPVHSALADRPGSRCEHDPSALCEVHSQGGGGALLSKSAFALQRNLRTL